MRNALVDVPDAAAGRGEREDRHPNRRIHRNRLADRIGTCEAHVGQGELETRPEGVGEGRIRSHGSIAVTHADDAVVRRRQGGDEARIGLRPGRPESVPATTTHSCVDKFKFGYL